MGQIRNEVEGMNQRDRRATEKNLSEGLLTSTMTNTRGSTGVILWFTPEKRERTPRERAANVVRYPVLKRPTAAIMKRPASRP